MTLLKTVDPRGVRLSCIVAFALVCFVSQVQAQVVTNRVLDIGGPGAKGCENMSDPPTLSNGTPASGTLGVGYDQTTQILTLTVTNTSAVTPGVENPVISRIWMNLSRIGSITNATLLSQVGSGGATPNFNLTIDTDVFTPPSPLNAGCFGTFSMRLQTANGLNGSIANAAAGTLPGTPGAMATGPVTFQILIATGSVNLTASAFTSVVSINSPGTYMTPAVFRFQGGGLGAGGEGNIGTGSQLQAGGFILGTPAPGETLTFAQTGTPGWSGCFIVSLDPGPTQFGPFLVPIGSSYVALLSGTIPPGGVLSTSAVVPNLGVDTALTFYGVVGLSDQTMMDVSVSDQFTLTINF